MGSISSRSVSLSLAEPLKFAWCAAASKGGLSSFPTQPRSASFVVANKKQTNCWALGLVDTGVQLIFGKLLRMRWRQPAIGDLRVCMQSCKKPQLRLLATSLEIAEWWFLWVFKQVLCSSDARKLEMCMPGQQGAMSACREAAVLQWCISLLGLCLVMALQQPVDVRC